MRLLGGKNFMIKATSVYKDNIYDCNVEIHGNTEEILAELKTLFESIIQSKILNSLTL